MFMFVEVILWIYTFVNGSSISDIIGFHLVFMHGISQWQFHIVIKEGHCYTVKPSREPGIFFEVNFQKMLKKEQHQQKELNIEAVILR